MMLGDKMLIYDKANDRFFAGWRDGKRNGSEIQLPTWSKSVKGAKIVCRLNAAYYIKEQLGLGMYIVSDDEANRIEALREYRLVSESENV